MPLRRLELWVVRSNPARIKGGGSLKVVPDECQLRQADLQVEGLLPDGVQRVTGGHLRFVLAAVAREADHLEAVLRSWLARFEMVYNNKTYSVAHDEKLLYDMPNVLTVS
jgi:hypothetical protein